MTALMIVVFIVLLVAGLGLIGWLIVRGSGETDLSEQDFDETYEALPESERPDGGDRDAAWKDFSGWRTEQQPQHDEWPEEEGQL